MKKLPALILAMTLVFSLAACGGDSTDPGTDTTVPTGNTEPSEDNTGLVDAQRVTGIRSERSEGDNDPYECYIEYKYEDGKLVGIKDYCDDVLKYEYTYDGSIDRPLTETAYYEDGTVEYFTEYKYDDSGVLVTDVDGPNTTMYDYDDDGRLVKKTSYTDDEENYRIEYVYADGVLTEEISYLYGEMEMHFLYDYDDDGRLVTIRDNDDGEKWNGTIYEYDDDGNMIHYGTEEDDYFYTYREDGILTGFKSYLSFGNDEAVVEYEIVQVSESEAVELKKIVEDIVW